MPARVVVVHDDPDFAIAATVALTLAGYSVAAFIDPLAALDVLEATQSVEVLITRVEFPPGKSNGIALARIVRTRRPGVRVLFIASQDLREFGGGLGEFLPMSTDPASVAEVVARLLSPSKPRCA